MVKLTEKQQSIYDYISRFTSENHFPPTFKEIAEHFNITVGTVQDHITAIQKKGYIERHKDIARGFKVTRVDKKAMRGAPTKLVPLYGSVAAGEPIFADDNIQGYITMHKDQAGHQIHFALKVKGESMIDSGIYDGDILIVRKQESADDGDIVIALLDDEATVKTLRNKRIKAYLEASNPKYKSIINKPFSIIGKVIELRRNFSGYNQVV